jgi:hypothetical protein
MPIMWWLREHFLTCWAWLTAHAALSWWLVGLSLLASLGGIWLVSRLVLSIPADYFTARRVTHGWRDRHPLIRWTLAIGKNALGTLLLALGVTMLVMPGPGVVTLLLALILLDVPGKRALEQRIISLPTVLHVINRIRARAGRPPVEAPSRRAAE